MNESYNSVLLDTAVAELAKLPGIGQKTALRLALHLLRKDPQTAYALGNAIVDMRRGVAYCPECHNISESGKCGICSDPHRDHRTICVVENVKDVLTIERTHEHHGVYHVLGGLISPLEGVAPSDIEIDSLISRVASGGADEVILALSPTMEGDTTSFYIFRKLADYGVPVTVLARGISIGNELEYTDELTLGRSILNRLPFGTESRK